MPYDTTIRVRYAETDQMGVVYHSNYLMYFEVGRVEALRALGIAYAELEARGFALAVAEASAQYLIPARYDDALIVRTRFSEMGKCRLTIRYEILRPVPGADPILLCTGTTTHAVLGKANSMRPVRLPDDVAAVIRAALEPDPCAKS